MMMTRSQPTQPSRRAMRPLVLLRVSLLAVVLSVLPGCVSLPGANVMTITAYFSDSAGLFTGNDVGILGVTVGRVTDIDPQGDRVEVTMEVDGDYDVPLDAGAVVVSRSVATDRYVELTPVYAGGKRLEDGGEIDLSRTRTPVDFDQVLESLNSFATGIAGSKETTEAVRRFIESGSSALKGAGQQFNDTLDSLSRAVNSAAGQQPDATAALIAIDELVGTVAQNEKTARTFIDQVSRASRQLDEEKENFRTALRALDRAVTTIAQFAVDNRTDLIKNVEGTSKLMKTVQSKQRQLAEILEVFPLALQNLERTRQDNGRIAVRLPGSVLVPLGAQLLELCSTLGLPVCDLLSGTDPTPQPPGGNR